MIAIIVNPLILLCQIIRMHVMPAGKRVSSAMDGELKPIHGAWIPAIPARMTTLEKGSSNHNLAL